jgi:hypothetical protein
MGAVVRFEELDTYIRGFYSGRYDCARGVGSGYIQSSKVGLKGPYLH